MRHRNSILLNLLILLIPITVLAGSLDDTGASTTEGGGAMNTLEDVYNIINDGTTNAPRTGTFAEPSAGPASTGHTLTEVYNRAKTSSRPAKTGQTVCYDVSGTVITCTGTGQDGDELKGVAWPDTRFTAAADTVTDNLTGLMWAKNANADGSKTWANALVYCNDLSLGGHDDWRLPNVKELFSLTDQNQSYPGLPSGHPFTNVQSASYWSSTTIVTTTSYAWYIAMEAGVASSNNKINNYYVWPVRGGQ